MAEIKLTCPHCDARLTAKTGRRVDRTITCLKCGRDFHARAEASLLRSRPFLIGIGAAALLLAIGVGLYAILPARKPEKEKQVEKDPGDGRRGSGGNDDREGASPDGKRYALLVGVKQYEHLPSLKFAENDVEELAKIFTPAGYEVILLSGSAADPARQPTGKNVRAAVSRVAANCRKGDTLVMAFAGHGLQIDETSYFCPSDAREKDASTLVSLHGVYRDMGRSRAGARLLLVDACRNTGSRTARRGIEGDAAARPPAGVAALFSCSANQFAFETDKLGAKGHGVFFHYVIEGLKGGAKNSDGEVSWDTLGDFVKKRVSVKVPELIGGGAKQTPHTLADLTGASPVLVRFDAREEFTNSLGMRFVRIPAGRFTMGSPKGEAGRKDDEQEHEVSITTAFHLGIYEVTQKQWKAVMPYHPSCYSADGTANPKRKYHEFSKPGGGREAVKGENTDDYPVENVTWSEAQDFIKKLDALPAEKEAGRSYRLPTEAEWEYACRAGTKGPFHVGDALTKAAAQIEADRPRKVGSFKPNAFGLYDMHGNAGEWCQDWYDKDYYQRSPKQDPAGPPEGTDRVIRGGGFWQSKPEQCRSASRAYMATWYPNNNIGFRLVLVRTK